MSDFEASASPRQADGLPIAPLRLRQAREAAGLHIAALAAALKVPVRKLEALEAGRYHELPDLTFARALAASASRHLKVEPAWVLEQIPGVVRPLLWDASPNINAPFRSGDEGSGGGAMAWLSQPVVWGVGLLLLAAIAVAVLPQGWVSRFQAGSAPASEPFVTTPGVVSDSPLAPAENAASENTAIASAPGAPVETSVALAPEVSLPAAAEPALTASSSGLLSIRAVNESWIEVINGSGVQVVQRVLKPGETLDFSAAPPYSVVVGRADAVQVTVRGQPLDVMPYARNSVARFEVK